MLEIEHKYLLRSDAFLREATDAIKIDQGYLSPGKPTVRVRRWGDRGYLTSVPSASTRSHWRRLWSSSSSAAAVA